MAPFSAQVNLYEDTVSTRATDKASKLTEFLFNIGKGHFGFQIGKCKAIKLKPWWDKRCKLALEKRRIFYKIWWKHPTRANQLNYRRQDAEFKKCKKNAKKFSWTTFTGELSFRTPLHNIWCFLNAMHGKYKAPVYHIRIGNGPILEPQKQAEILAEYYETVLNSNKIIPQEQLLKTII